MNVSALVSYLGCLSRKRPCSELAEETLGIACEDLLDQGPDLDRWMVEQMLMRQLVYSAGGNNDPKEEIEEARKQILAILDEAERYIGR